LAATTLTGDGSGITGVSASAIKADDLTAGDAAVTISTATGAINITPASGSAIVLDGAVNVDAGVVTGVTTLTGGSNGTITIDPNGSGTLALGSADNTAVTVDALAITATSINALTLTDGTASFALGGTGATTLSAATTVDLDGTGAMSLNSSGGAINIGNDVVSQAINVGTHGAGRTMVVGNSQGTTSVSIISGTGDIALTSADKITISASSGSQTNGTGGVVDFTGSQIENFKASIYEDSGHHTLTAGENGKIIVFTSSSNVTLTVPTNLAIGFNCLIIQEGTGVVSITAAAGSTVRNRNSHVKTAGQYAVMSLLSYSNNIFISSGDGAS